MPRSGSYSRAIRYLGAARSRSGARIVEARVRGAGVDPLLGEDVLCLLEEVPVVVRLIEPAPAVVGLFSFADDERLAGEEPAHRDHVRQVVRKAAIRKRRGEDRVPLCRGHGQRTRLQVVEDGLGGIADAVPAAAAGHSTIGRARFQIGATLFEAGVHDLERRMRLIRDPGPALPYSGHVIATAPGEVRM